jgi:hypothetical protein
VFDEALYATSPAAAVVTRVKRSLNDGMRIVLNEPGLQRLVDNDDPWTFSSVAGQARYVLPDLGVRILRMVDVTNRTPLETMSRDTYRRVQPDPTVISGLSTHYVPIGRVAVAVQPTAAAIPFAVSTSAGDTTQTVFIEGVTSGNLRVLASVTLTGLTPVALSTLSFLQIDDFYLSAVGAGTVSLTQGSGGATLASIVLSTVETIRPRYTAFDLYPTPSGVVSYSVDYRRSVTDMVNATDEPPLPVDFHGLLVDYAVTREFEIKGDTERIVIAGSRFQKRLSRLKYATQYTGDEQPILGRSRSHGISRLGGYYPADTRG